MKSTIVWSIWLFSGLMIILLLGSIVNMMIKSPNQATVIQPRYDAVDMILSTSEAPKEDGYVQEKIKIVYSRKGYSNPKLSSEDEDFAQDTSIKQRKRSKRPLKLIGKDFNPYRSYTIKHPNGTLTYVFPSPEISSTTISTTIPIGAESHLPPTLIDRYVPDEPSYVYPTKLIDDIMNEHRNSFQGAFETDLLDSDKLNQRFHSFEKSFVCDSRETMLRPEEGTSIKNSRVKIVNTDNYKQGVRIETCRNEGQPCLYCDENTMCKQLYHYRTLVVVDLDERKPYKELIQLPSCCKCVRISP